MSAAILALAILAAGAAGASEPGLTLSDLAAYRAALEGPPSAAAGGAASALPATFRDLWEHPARYQGRRVRVVGRVARRFRQSAFGTFPPLVESWAVTPAGDPLCLVYPATATATTTARDPDAAPGASVEFEGTFLRRLRYQGGDADRLAPLIVGSRPPVVTSPAPAPSRKSEPGTWPALGPRSWTDWTMGLAAAAFVALVLARRHLPSARPVPRKRGPDDDRPPEFVA